MKWLDKFLKRDNSIPNVLLGTAIGDALGMPFETMKYDNPFLMGWDGKNYIESQSRYIKYGHFDKLEAGTYTDDTQMSILVAQSLLEHGHYNVRDIIKKYINWVDSNLFVGAGKSTLTAIASLKEGMPFDKCGIEGALGNGSAMRAAPFGAFFGAIDNDTHDRFSAMHSAVRIDSNITHRSIEAEAGALAIAITTYLIVRQEEEKISHYLSVHLPESDVKKLIFKAYELSQYKELVEPRSLYSPIECLKIIGTNGNVKQTVPAAMYCYFKFHNFEDAVLAAIRAGGDCDTLGAIVGAMFGAKTPVRNMPRKWVKGIRDPFGELKEIDRQIRYRKLNNR